MLGVRGGNLPDTFVTAALRMLEHELQINGKRKDPGQRPSVSPWDGMVFELSPTLILSISRAYARQLQLRPTRRLRELDDSEFLYDRQIDADLV